MSITKLDVSLEEYEIGLSGAIPDRSEWSEPAMDRGILEFVALFSGLVFKYGGRIVHGSHPTFTPIILRQARLQAPSRSRKPITLVMSDLWAADLSSDEIDSLTDVSELIVTKKIGGGSAADTETRNRSLSAMREVLVDAQNLMVAVGGKMHSGDGKIPGVGEEIRLAQKKGIPQFLVAGLGGFARKLAKDLTPTSLNNSLSLSANVRLFSTRDVSASVNLLFEHLARSRPLAESALQPVKWNPGLKAILDHRDGTIRREVTQFIDRAIGA
jgi:SLOG-like protein